MLLAAAIIITVIGLVHSMLGEKTVIMPLLSKNNIPAYIARLLRVAWHMITLFWFAIAAQLAVMHFRPDEAYQSFLIIMTVTFGVSALIALIQSKGKHLSWVGFGAATILLGYVAAF